MGWPLDVRSAGARFYMQANYNAAISGEMLVPHLKR
jgi:hypothetical protein